MTEPKTKGEPQYEEVIRLMRERGPERMGLMTSWAWYSDPKRLGFMLARYKFVAKMLEGANHVLEVGCGDGFGSLIVAQAVKAVTAVDFDVDFVESARAVASDRWPVAFKVHDVRCGPVEGTFDGVYSLDVLEHIPVADERRFIANMIAPLTEHGTCIIGTPSLESQTFASLYSRLGHVNCKDQRALKTLMRSFFHSVFVFSMNDEVVHTGHHAMSHYNLCVCCGKIVADDGAVR
jgi:cyclopropane fatty-acyl-phospholipid synthase-like methyltransferase